MRAETGPLAQAAAILVAARRLAETLRFGNDTVAEARKLDGLIREAEGWLLSARRFLDPSQVV